MWIVASLLSWFGQQLAKETAQFFFSNFCRLALQILMGSFEINGQSNFLCWSSGLDQSL